MKENHDTVQDRTEQNRTQTTEQWNRIEGLQRNICVVKIFLEKVQEHSSREMIAF